MSNTARLIAYYGQNGSYRLTPKQRRRADKKEVREFAAMQLVLNGLVAGGEPGRGKSPIPVAAQ